MIRLKEKIVLKDYISVMSEIQDPNNPDQVTEVTLKHLSEIDFDNEKDFNQQLYEFLTAKYNLINQLELDGITYTINKELTETIINSFPYPWQFAPLILSYGYTGTADYIKQFEHCPIEVAFGVFNNLSKW